jgi:type III secretory pathway component EscS
VIVGMIVISLVGYVIFNHESNKVLNYTIREQIKDVLPSFILACFMGLIVFMVGYMSDYHHSITLVIQIIAGMLTIMAAGEWLKLKEYVFFKGIMLEKFQMFLRK